MLSSKAAFAQLCFALVLPAALRDHTHTANPHPSQPQDATTLTKTSILPLMWQQCYKSHILRYLMSPYGLSAAGAAVRNGPRGRRNTNHGKGVTVSCPEETDLCFIVSIT